MECDTNPKRPAPNNTALKQEILSALDSIQPCGSFACFSLPHRLYWLAPDLEAPKDKLPFIQGYGEIGRSDQESEVGELVKRYIMPNSNLSNTEDDIPNKFWKLDATHFTESVCWQNYVWDDICPRVCEELGVDQQVASSVRAEIRNIVLQQSGPMRDFDVQLSSRSSQNIIGTLVVSLPSSHNRGDILLTHSGRQIVYSTQHSHQYSYAAWYCEADHEITPLVRGTRIMMVFDLVFESHDTNLSPPSVPNLGMPHLGGVSSAIRRWLETQDSQGSLEQHAPEQQFCLRCRFGLRYEGQLLRAAVNQWLESQNQPGRMDCLFHVFSRTYEGAGGVIFRHMLEEQDATQVEALEQLTHELPFQVFLVSLVKKARGKCEDDWEMRYDEQTNRLVGGDWCGEPWHHMIEVDAAEYSITGIFDLDGTTLMNGVSMLSEDERKFIQTRALLRDEVEKEENDYGAFQGTWGPLASHTYKAHMCESLHQDPPSQSQSELWEQLRSGDPTFETVLEATIYLERFNLFKRIAAENHNPGVAIVSLSDRARRWVEAEPFDAPGRFARIREGLIQELAQRGDKLGEQESYLLLAIAHSMSGFVATDYFATIVLQRIPPAQMKSPAMYLSFLSSLTKEIEGQDLLFDSQAAADHLYKVVAKSLLETIDFATMEGHDWDEWNRVNLGARKAQRGVTTADDEDLRNMYSCLLCFHLMDAMRLKRDHDEPWGEGADPAGRYQYPNGTSVSLWTSLMNKIIEQASNLPYAEFENFWILVVSDFIEGERITTVVEDISSQREVPGRLVKEVRQKTTALIRLLIKSFAVRYIGRGCRANRRRDRFCLVIQQQLYHPLGHRHCERVVGRELHDAIIFSKHHLLDPGGRGCLSGYNVKKLKVTKLVRRRGGKKVEDGTWDLSLH
ncbi:hypothetical protein QBC40DRAFT_353086 [Triangularia verruculosa]|uniref:Prolyl 4-hydroxylase alpha subunit Fe(2+) 2OG dioxygenase domain-containing protein n=1 Tax=Triangularia verruculosa TaxID=2587418 RepID=A0AAN6X9T7_9PEZI|nr:hypothetical protein QBC40DRAFT_353086 [Triangularia verruculosa]